MDTKSSPNESLLRFAAILVIFVALGRYIATHGTRSSSVNLNKNFKETIQKKISETAHRMYQEILEDPDADKDGLTDFAEFEIYESNSKKADSLKAGVKDGLYVNEQYKQAFQTGDETLVKKYRENKAVAKLDKLSSLDSAFRTRSLQSNNPFIGLAPEVVEQVKQAFLLVLQKKGNEATQLVRGELVKDPNSSILKYQLALLYIGSEETSEGLAILHDIETDPAVASPLLYLTMADAYLITGDEKKYEEYLKLSIEIFPEYLDQYVSLAEFYLKKDQLKGAEEVLTKGIAVEPRFASFYNGLAGIAGRKNDYKKELEYYQKITELDFAYPSAHFNISLIYAQKYNDKRNALVEAKIAAELKDSPNYKAQIMNLEYELGNYAAANKIQKELQAMDNLDSRTYNTMGLLALNQKDYVAAEKSFRKAITLEPDLPNPHNNLGIALEYLGRYEESAQSYRRAIELNPNYTNAYSNLGIHYLNKKDFDEAKRLFEKALQLDPTHFRANANLGVMYERMGDREKMLYYYRKAVEYGYDDPAVIKIIQDAQ